MFPLRNEQRNMQVMQPAHLDGSALIERLSLLTLVVIHMDYSRSRAGIEPSPKNPEKFRRNRCAAA